MSIELVQAIYQRFLETYERYAWTSVDHLLYLKFLVAKIVVRSRRNPVPGPYFFLLLDVVRDLLSSVSIIFNNST